MQLSGWSLLVLWYISFPFPLPILWGSFQVHQQQMVSLSPSSSIASSVFYVLRSRHLSFVSPSFDFTLLDTGTTKSTLKQVFILFFFWGGVRLALILVVWLRLGNPFVFQNSWEVCSSHSLGQILGCTYTTCSHGQRSISCIIPSESPFLPSRVYSYTLFTLICRVHVLCDWLFRRNHHIIYTYYFVASGLFLF